MESQPQNPEFKINPENFHPCIRDDASRALLSLVDYSTNKAQHKKKQVVKNISMGESSKFPKS